MEAISIREVCMAVQGKIIFGEENGEIKKVSTNSRDELDQGLFVPIIGERADAHDYIKDAFENGAIVVFTQRHQSRVQFFEDPKIDLKENDSILQGKTVIAVENTLKALQKLATYYREKFIIPVVGISGSVGKTTTKEMISAALETKFNTLKTFGNMNSQIGVSLMMFELDANKEVAVIEMGISEPFEMDCLVHIAKPKYAVLTNIGVSHIGNLKSQENIRKEKSKIVNEFLEDSVLYVNGDDPLLEEIYEESQAIKAKTKNVKNIDLSETTREKIGENRVCAFGTSEYCDFRAVDIVTEDEKTRFTLVHPKGTEEIKLSVCGIHHVRNALVALAIANEFGIAPSVAKSGLESYRPIKMRGEIHSFGQVKVIDDTYNASPDSMKSGIHTLLALSDVNRRIAILADVLELGELSKDCHYGVGLFLKDTSVDVLVTVGNEAKYIAEALKDNDSNIECYSFDNNDQVNDFLKGFVREKDGILVKGSRGMHMEQIVEGLNKRFNKL